MECKKILNNHKKLKIKTIIMQIGIIILFIFVWEILAKLKVIDTFLFSQPSKIMILLYKYIITKEIFKHIYISLIETVLGIIIGSILGIVIASILWYFPKFALIIDPFLVILNALPKTALAPIIIIWAGTGISGIVVVAISILLVLTILSTYQCFKNVDTDKIKMLETYNAKKIQIFTKLIFPANIANIINIVKINIGMAWVGVIVGEFLVSRYGIGYLIMYGGQVFKLDLVMMGIIVLSVLAYIMYEIVNLLEKYIIKKRG